MPQDKNKIIAIESPVEITAAKSDDGKGPASFSVVAYTGDKITVAGWDAPVVVDLDGVTPGKSLIANLDHESSKRVGHVTESSFDGQIVLAGKISAATDAAREVKESANNGFVWQASIEAQPTSVTEVDAGEKVTVNGREFEGPLYVAAKSILKGFAFVSHGADDNTSVAIAAAHSDRKENTMDKDLKKWIEAMGFEVDKLSESQLAGLKANYDGRQSSKPTGTIDLGAGIEAKKAEAERVDAISQMAITACEKHPLSMDAIKELAEQGIEAKWSVDKFRLELLEATLPPAHTVFSSPRNRDAKLNNRVLEAAICQAGGLENIDKHFNDETLQAAHDRFRSSGIGLKQLLLMCAEANGYKAGYSQDVNVEVQRAAFGMTSPQSIHASSFSTLSISNVLAATANKFLMEGWNAVDQAWRDISSVRPVRNFQQITTVSLTGDLQFTELGAGGEIQHGTLSDLTYTNQADTYARMLAITRKDIINDDLGALTAVPRRLGRGGALKLNDIFWTAFLDNSTFFTAGRNNVSTDTGALGLTGLDEANTIFKNQTDPDGKPLGIMPRILLVPTELETTALQLMNSEKVKGDTNEPDANPWRGRFRVVTSPYMSNSSYTGYSTTVWYLLADPRELPVIEVAALNGNVQPVIETADADFNVLGIQMRGYSDVGVSKQEYRAGVRADGSAAD